MLADGVKSWHASHKLDVCMLGLSHTRPEQNKAVLGLPVVLAAQSAAVQSQTPHGQPRNLLLAPACA